MPHRHRLDAECYDRTEEGIAALAEAGVRTSRYGLSWATLLDPRGRFKGYYAEAVGVELRRFQGYGIEPVLILWDIPRDMAGAETGEIGGALASVVERLSGEHGYGDFPFWEIMNEPDVGFDWRVFGMPPDRIVNDPPSDWDLHPPGPSWETHHAVVGRRWNGIVREIREVVPGLILSGALGRPGTLQHIDPDLYDIASIHAYGTPEHILEQGRTARRLIPEGTELWLTEHNATPPTLSDVDQARAVIDFARAHTAEPVYDRTLLYVWDRARKDPWYWLSDETKEAVRAWNAGEIPLRTGY